MKRLSNITLNCSALCLALCLIGQGWADSVRQKTGGLKNVTVTAISAQGVTIDNKQQVPLDAVRQVEFDALMVVAQPQKLLLTDGSVLSGTLQRFSKTNATFRSTSLGPLVLPLTSISAIFFSSSAPNKDFPTPRKGNIMVRLSSRGTKEGRLFLPSSMGIILRTKSGLEKVSFSDVQFIAFRPSSRRSRIVLRNGDILNMQTQWQGKTFLVSLFGRKTTLSIKALKRISLKN